MRAVLGLAMAVAMTGLGTGAMAQDAPPAGGVPAAEALTPEAPTGPQWKVFSRSNTSNYLIDLASIRPEGDELRVRIARVPIAGEATDLSHVVDAFGLRCSTGESHVITSTEVLEDGVTAETFQTDEPWSEPRGGSLDATVKELACEDMVPSGDAYSAITDYIAAGRP
jgi:hypothetical protein